MRMYKLDFVFPLALSWVSPEIFPLRKKYFVINLGNNLFKKVFVSIYLFKYALYVITKIYTLKT